MIRVLTVIVLFSVACASQDRPNPDPVERDPALVWVEQVGAAHGRVDALVGEGELARASEELRGLLNHPAPSGVSPEDARPIRLDARFRLAEVLMLAGDADAALAEAEAGLSEARNGRDRLFTANLLVAKGRALEALGREVEATEPYFQALEINRALLSDTLNGEN